MSGSARDPEAMQQTMLKKRLYIIFTEPVEGAGDRGAVLPEHLEYQMSLEKDGILFAAGPFVDDETGKPQGPGMIVIRAETSEAAAAIADRDPFHAKGYRTYRVQPWQINEGGFNLRVRFSQGTYTLD